MTLSIFEAARDSPQNPALVSEGRTHDFADLAERVRGTLRWLEERGLSRTDPRPVALVATRTRRCIELLLALFEAHVTVLPLHPRLTARERAALLVRCPVQLLVDGATGELLRGTANSGDSSEPGERALVVMPTSGTSGTPKLVVLSRRAFSHSARASRENLRFSAADRWLLCLPLAHVGGLSIITRCLAERACVVSFEPDRSPGGVALRDVFARERITLASLVPAQLERLLDEAPALEPNPELRGILLGGAPAPDRLVRRAEARNIPVLPSYGLSVGRCA